MKSAVFTDPSVAGPDMPFSTGQVVNGTQTFAPTLPDILGDPDPGWNITQWNTPASEIFDPAGPVRDDPSGLDAVLGRPLATWRTGDASGGSLLSVYGTAGDVSFRLGATGGDTRDTFLQSTGYAPGSMTFDRQIDVQAQERIALATAGTGTAIAFNSFTVFFNAGDNPSYDSTLPQTELFLQVPLTDFRGEPTAFSTITAFDTYQKIYNVSSQAVSADGSAVADESADYLSFATDSGALHTVDIDLNQALLRMVAQMASQVASQDPALARAYLDLSKWSLGSVYTGVETGGGDGSDPASLSLDVAHLTVTRDTSAIVSQATPLSTVQSIDGGAYAEGEDSPQVETMVGTLNTIALTGTLSSQVLTSHGSDTVLVGDAGTDILHALGTSLDVIGSVARYGSLSIDGTASLSLSGSFGSLSVQSDANGIDIAGTVVSTAALTLGGTDDSIALSGDVDAMLSGSGASLAAGGGQLSLFADGDTVDQNGGGTQTVFLNGHVAAVTQTGAGSQVIVGLPTTSGHVTVEGGHGRQTLWTGGSDGSVLAGGDGSLAVHVQAGSRTDVQLGRETALLDTLGGTLTVAGSTDRGEAVTLFDGAGDATVWGGAETMTASVGAQGSLQIQAGGGDQTIFGSSGRLLVLGSHDSTGSQIIVNGDDPTGGSTVFGGRTAQTVWTGNASDTIVSSTLAGDASGSIQAIIQGGTSAYWGGVESATLQNQGGILDAFLNGDGAVSILASMTGNTSTVLHGFNAAHDHLILTGLTDPSAVLSSSSAGDTTLAFGNSRVVLAGVAHVGLSQAADGIAVWT